jgi:hypothetical protein
MLVACMFTWWQRWDETEEGDNEAVTADDDEELVELENDLDEITVDDDEELVELENDLDEIFEVVHGIVAIADELANKSITPSNVYLEHVTNINEVKGDLNNNTKEHNDNIFNTIEYDIYK